tara:strand:- start:2357 stop:2536 length:180 start_codon:yes stop_codon:yes gene_type:complete
MGYSATGTFETFGVNSLSEPTWDKKEHFEIKQNTIPWKILILISLAIIISLIIKNIYYK